MGVEKKMVRASALVLAFCMLFDPRASWTEKTQKHMIVDLVKNTETTQKQMIVDWVKKKSLTKDQAIALNSSPFFSGKCTGDKFSGCTPAIDFDADCGVVGSVDDSNVRDVVESPTACIIDSQSVKSAEKGGPVLILTGLMQAN
jgi:hypothetical protein